MKLLAEQLKQYQAQHTEKTNRLAHYIGIPAIVLGTLLLLSWISVSIAAKWHISFAWIAVIALLIYYYFLDIKMAAVMTVVMVIVTLLCTWIAYPAPTKFGLTLFLILFIGGWLLQFIGHTLEKVKPSFFNTVGSILIAPLFVVAELIVALGLGKYFDLEDRTPPPPTSRSGTNTNNKNQPRY